VTSNVVELVRVTVATPDRRLDVALPDRVAVAALLPVLLRGGGSELADRGAAHGGWLLRDVAGTPLDTGRTLVEQGVRDGDLLCLALADEAWPELDYDDVVDAIAGGSDRRGGPWGPAATRIASLVAAGVLLAVAFAVLWASGGRPAMPGVALGLAGMLAASAVVAARAYRRQDLAPLLAAGAALFAFTGGWWAADRLSGTAAGGTVRLMVACAAVVVAAVGTGLGVGQPGAVPVAAVTFALFGLVGGAVGTVASAGGAAAVVLGSVALTSGLAPPVAARIGGLPRPEGLPSPDTRPTRERDGTVVDTDELFHAVVRTDGVLSGLLAGAALAAAFAGVVLVGSGGWPGRVLVAATATGLGLRARAYAGLAHRTVALSGAALVALPLLAEGLGGGAAGPTVAAALTAAALFTIITGTGAATRSPYFGRLGDILEVVSVASVVPLVCLALGLYGRLRGLHV